MDLFDKRLDFTDFKNRLVKAGSIFKINKIDKSIAYQFIKEYHYLKDAKFFAKYSYGLYYGFTLVGVSTYSNPQGISSLKGWFSMENQKQSVLELSRLCLLPDLNGSNASSFLLGRSIKLLKKESVRAVITLADSNRHVGSIYQVCNFKYYGLTDKKSDFYSNKGVNTRGKTKDLDGVWLPRNRKHRYCYLIDKSLSVNYKEEPKPMVKKIDNNCCNSEGVVFDSRFKKTYACPKCNDVKKFGLIDIYNLKDFV